MLDHVTLRVTNRAASERFYETLLATLGFQPTHSDERFVAWDDFSIAQASGDRPATRGLHIGFVSPSREHVDRFWQVGTAAGYPDAGWIVADRPDRARFSSGSGSFSVVDGKPAQNVHLAFPVTENAAVDAFFEAMTDRPAPPSAV